MNNLIALAQRLTKAPTEDEAEAAGYDCGLRGVTTENCHFSLFMRPVLTRAWERGQARAKNQPPAEPAEETKP